MKDGTKKAEAEKARNEAMNAAKSAYLEAIVLAVEAFVEVVPSDKSASRETISLAVKVLVNAVATAKSARARADAAALSAWYEAKEV